MDSITRFRKNLAQKTFDEKKNILTDYPFFFQINDFADLYTLMYSDKSPDETDLPVMKYFVGTILRKDDDVIVGYGFDRTTQIILETEKISENQNIDTLYPLDDGLGQLQHENIAECAVSLYQEGTKMTVFYHNDRWFISTNRMIDAGRAFWSGTKSFKEEFLDACRMQSSHIYDQLINNSLSGPMKKEFSYVFILSSPSICALSSHDNPYILHAGTTDTTTLNQIDDEIGICRPSPINYRNFHEMVAALSTFEYWMPGFIVASPSRRYKLLTKTYDYVRNLTGNTPDIRKAYLELRHDHRKRADFLKYYPGYMKMTADVERMLWDIAKKMHTLYITYFVRKEERPQFDKTVFVTLMQIHSMYMETRQKQTLQLVYRHINYLMPNIQRALMAAI